MKIFTYLGVVLFLGAMLIQGSCKPKEKLNKSDDICVPILIDANFMDKNGVGKNVMVQGASIKGDCLTLEVAHGGGCPTRDDKYTLVWDKKILKSMPPQVILKLHLDSEDNCKAMVRRTLTYDIAALQEANPRGQVMVRIRNYDGRLSYEFGQDN